MAEERFIKYGDRKMPMGDMTLEQAKQIMARHFPELADPDVKTEKKDGETVYVFSKKAGRKGARRRKVGTLRATSVLLHATPLQQAVANLRSVTPAAGRAALVTPGLIDVALGQAAPADGDLAAIVGRLRDEAAGVERARAFLLDLPPAVTPRGDVLL